MQEIIMVDDDKYISLINNEWNSKTSIKTCTTVLVYVNNTSKLDFGSILFKLAARLWNQNLFISLFLLLLVKILLFIFYQNTIYVD